MPLPTSGEVGPAPLPVRTEDIQKASLTGALQNKEAWREYLGSQVHDAASRPEAPNAESDAMAWFLSKRAHAAINRWLLNSRFSVLAEVSPARTGFVLLTQQRIAHVLAQRANQGVGIDAVVELFTQLFVEGGASFAANHSGGERRGGYDGQLVMFTSYTSSRREVSGLSPTAILKFQGSPPTHLRLETAYWSKASKIAALRESILH